MKKNKFDLVVNRYFSDEQPEDFYTDEFISFFIDIFKAASKTASATISYKEIDLSASKFYKIIKNLFSITQYGVFTDGYSSTIKSAIKDTFEDGLDPKYNLLLMNAGKTKITLYLKTPSNKTDPKISARITVEFESKRKEDVTRYYTYRKDDIENIVENIYNNNGDDVNCWLLLNGINLTDVFTNIFNS